MFSDASGRICWVPVRPMPGWFNQLWTNQQEQREQYSCISETSLAQHGVMDPETAM